MRAVSITSRKPKPSVVGPQLTLATCSLIHDLAGLAALGAEQLIRQLREVMERLHINESFLGILSQMGPFSQGCETTYSFGLALDRDALDPQHLRILFSLRNVCKDPNERGAVNWAVNHITILHAMDREKDNASWLVIEDYNSVSGSQERLLSGATDTTMIGKLNLCTLGWTTALIEVEEIICAMVNSSPLFVSLENLMLHRRNWTAWLLPKLLQISYYRN